MNPNNPAQTFHLYTFFASSCAARIRIAFNLKNLPVISHYVDMRQGEHNTGTYRTVNPSASIPTLVIETSRDNDGEAESSSFSISQSVAILEYLEEVFPERIPLLPPTSEPEGRARVRELMYIVTSDIFPPTNAKIARRVKAIRDSEDDQDEFVKKVMSEGFAAYEKMLELHFKGKKYSAGDYVTLADVCLVPQAEQARFYGIDFAQWPLLNGVLERLEALDAFKKAGWKYQEDTPEKHKLQ
jgi:maleylacetoacetate isomerase